MKRTRFIIRAIALGCVLSCVFASAASAYWVWTPDTKKFINPKYAVKDSPKEQYQWAMSFYDAKDYQRAATEFEKLVKSYEFSIEAGMAQYHVGLCYENLAKYYLAFQAYQKAIDNFPHLDNVEEIIAREFNIANIYAEKENPKVLGADIMTSTDRVVEIYKKVVENAPYGKLADQALFNMGQALKKVERYDEAVPAFQKILDEYPGSEFTERARYEVAYCAYKASLKPAYDQAATDKAIKAFSDYSEGAKDEEMTKEAAETIKRLKDKAAEKSLLTAQFYERINKKQAAIIYYQDILDRYPDCSYATLATEKIDELKNGKKRAVSGDVQRGGLFAIFAPPAPTMVAVPPVAGAAPVAPVPQEKKGWFSGLFGKKAPPAQPPLRRPRPVRRNWMASWFPADEPPIAAPLTEPVPLAPLEPSTPASGAAALTPAPGTAAPTPEAAASMPTPVTQEPALAVPAGTQPALAPVPIPQPATVARQPLTVVSKPAVAPAPKKKGWSSLLSLIGFGSDAAEPAARPVSVASAVPLSSGPAVAVEPLHDGGRPAPSPDDVNVEKDRDDYR